MKGKDQTLTDLSYIDRNLGEIIARMERARARSPYGQPVRLLLATKYASADEINRASAYLGHALIGENRVQQLLEKYESLDRERLEIHFIGTLQKNKVKYIIDKVDMIESVDSVELAREIDRRAADAGIVMDVLAEINIGEEGSKSGIRPSEAGGFTDALAAFPHIRVCGLMTMAPKCTDNAMYHRFFSETYHIFIDISNEKLHNIDKPVLSMGMSESFETAIEEGAGIVRVGRAAFTMPEKV